MKIEITKLQLLSPLFYVSAEGLIPFEYREGDLLFCFELEEAQYRNFEPEGEAFFKNQVFAGKAVKGLSCGELELPGGNYLFAQEREILSKGDTIAMALEIQKEGLWQRLKPGRRLYLRYLFEDGSPVTQLFRPYVE